MRVFHLSHNGIMPIFRATMPVRLDWGVILSATNCVGTTLHGIRGMR